MTRKTKRRSPVIATAAWLAVALVIPVSVFAAMGRTSGSFSVSPTGSANYSIPLWVPPGPRGMQPDLALVYDSRNRGGTLGVGWGLAGLSAITRCNKTVAQDSTSAAVTLTFNDVFCLDGKRLRITNNPLNLYGQPGTTYQTEIADFSLVTAVGTAGVGPASFIVKGKNGLTYKYGDGNNSRVQATGTTTAVAWMLREVSDRANNRMVIEYNAPDSTLTGATTPARIRWTPSADESTTFNYTMEFNYVDNNPATSIIGFVAGTSVLNADLLANIEVKSSGTTVRKYVLTYEISPTSGVHRLQQVKECADAAATDCMLPTIISYQNGQAGIATSATPVLSGNLVVNPLHDFNGDGLNDIAHSSTAWSVAFGSTSGTFGSPVATGIAASTPSLFGDVRGSGTYGILAANGPWWYYTWNGSSFAGVSTGLAVDSSANSRALADVNGDGRPDLISMRWASSGPDAGIRVFVNLNTSSGGAVSFSTPATLGHTAGVIAAGASAPFLISGSVQPFEINGDGFEDALYGQSHCSGFIPPGQCVQFTYRLVGLISQGNGAFTSTVLHTEILSPVNPMVIVQFTNWNNDACTDVTINAKINIAGCNGTVPVVLTAAGAIFGTMDWNGDGRTDAIVGNGATWSVQLSTGAGLSSAAPTSISWPSGSTCAFVKFDAQGDGLDDLGQRCQNGAGAGFTYYAHNGTGTPPDLVSSITDGYGVNVSPSYVSLTRGVASGVYQKASDATYPYSDYIGPLQVVSSFTASDLSGLPSGTYTTNLRYVGAWMQRQGRGFAGFDHRRTIDSRNNLQQFQFYRRDFPFTGFLRQSTTYQSNGTTHIAQEIHAPASQTLESSANNQRYFVFPSSTTRDAYEFGGPKNGLLITTSTVNPTFDGFGNATNVTTVVIDKDAGSPYFNQQWSSTTARTVLPDTGSNWCLNMPTTQTITNSAPGVPNVTRTTNFTPDYVNCRISQTVTEPSSGTYAVTESYSFDGFGNISTVNVTGAGMTTRTSTVDWGTTGQFSMTIKDPVGFSLGSSGYRTVKGYDFNRGLQTSEVVQSADGSVNNTPPTSWAYDSFGRKTQETRADGTSTTWTYNDCTVGGCVNSANKMTVAETILNAGGGTQTDRFIYLNRYGKPLVESQRMLGSGAYDRIEVQYDSLGRVAQQAAPCTWSGCALYWTTNTYDAVGRLTQTQRPISATNSTLQTTTIQYAGRTTTTTDAQGKQSTKIMTVAQTLGRSQDHDGYHQNFSYDAFGSLLAVTDSLSNNLFSATYEYGVQAFQKTVSDLDLGGRTNTFNALGELTGYTDAKSQNFSMTYDALSRPLTRTEPDLATSWTWGASAASHNVGRLQNVSASSYQETYTYDGAGRLASRGITIPSDATYTYDFAYHPTTGLLDTLTYPLSTSSYRLKLQYTYENGLPKSVSDFNAPSTVFWTAGTMNARGHVTQETLGNGVITNRSFDAVTGWLGSQQSGVSGGAALQNESYLTDLVGNVIQRQNNNVGLTENFFYDNLYRLDSSTLGGSTNLDLGYEATGNITSRSDVAGGATWTYHATKKHAVTQAGSGAYTYSYDANGNVTSRSGYTVTWASYNHPSLINGADGESVAFAYTHNHERWRAILTTSAGIETTYFVGELLEKVVTAGASDYRHHIMVGNTKVGLYSRTTGGTNTLRYVREDHQGSIAGILNSNGTSFVKESFTPFGKRRNTCTWSGQPTSGQMTKINSVTRRGYTWHTALGNMGLNDMNGRIQDAVTGRFLSPDPLIPDPMNTQSYNRYSYVMNNPLTFTDPSGFEPYCFQTYVVRTFVTPELGLVSVVAFGIPYCIELELPDYDWDHPPPPVPSSTSTPDDDDGARRTHAPPGQRQAYTCPAVDPGSPGTQTQGQVAFTSPGWKTAFAYFSGEASLGAAQEQHPSLSLHNDAGDAFRHFRWNFSMARTLGAESATRFANGYEVSHPPTDPRETTMDLFNNAMGRAMGVDRRFSNLNPTDAAWFALSRGCLQEQLK